MGTPLEKLRLLLKSKKAIQQKFNLPADLPFSQYADAIDSARPEVPDTPDVPLENVDVALGVVDANGNFHPLEFDGTASSVSGPAEIVDSYHTWNVPDVSRWGSWDELSAMVQAGQFTNDNLGEIIEVEYTIHSEIGDYKVPLRFEIVAVDDADLTNASLKHSLTLWSMSVLGEQKAGNYIWSNKASLRTWLSTTFSESLDPAFKAHIAPISRTMWKSGTAVVVSVDTVFLPSCTELGFGANNGIEEERAWTYVNSDKRRSRGAVYWMSSRGASNYYVRTVAADGSEGINLKQDKLAGVCPALVFA